MCCVIDELSRGDPGRVFGEALTYVEKSKRDIPFTLASGHAAVVPSNLIILATMNPFDRGVDEVDAAFERRFARIAMDPDRNILQSFLDGNEVQDPLRREIVRLFEMMNSRARSNPQAAVGHTFFTDVRDVASFASVWNHQLGFSRRRLIVLSLRYTLTSLVLGTELSRLLVRPLVTI